MIKIGKIVFGTLFFLVSTQIFAQKNPCNFTEERKGDTVIYKGEMNYLGTTHAELRISLQFQMIGNELGLVFGLNNIDGISMDSTNVAYIQLANDKEYILTPKQISLTKDNKRLECRYVVSEQDEQNFISYVITGIYISTNIHPQIDISDFNRYTARRISERFKCAHDKIKNTK